MIGQTISHYKIIDKLGEGGMGVVYRAHDTKLDRDVALKFLPPELTRYEEEKHRFIHEARTASALDHPNIGVVHEIDETEDGRSFICMAYYQGETLKKKIDRGPPAIQESINIAFQITEGLNRAHEAGIIHRDIKPANILITDRGEVKIVDFGLAKLIGDPISTGSRSRAGTAAYMSPEQIQGGEVDKRTDLFSLGVVLYEMVTGTRPFAGEHEVALFYSIVNLEPEPPSKIKTGISNDLEKIILKLLQKDPAKRYQSAAELLTELNLLKRGISIPVIPQFKRMIAYFTKHKLITLFLLTAIIILCVFIVIIKPRTTLPLEPSEYILVANFENLTNNRIFDHSLTEAIKVSLRQSARLNLFPSERIAEALKRMKIPESQPLNDTIAVAVAHREGVRVVIAGGISPLGKSYVLSSKVIDAVSGEMLRFTHREVVGVEKILSAMDRLCEDIRESLGESAQEISKYSMPLEKVTTSSLEALELYSRGNAYEGQGKYQEAAILKEQAVAKDSFFTIAISDLSYIHRKLGNDSLAIYYHNRVFPILNRVTDRERFYILSIYYGPSFEFDYQKAFQNIQQLVLRYPNSAEGYATLAHLAMYVGDTKLALEASQRSLEIDSVYAGTVFNNMGYALALSGNAVEAMKYFHKSKAIRPTYYAIDGYIAQCYWVKEQYDSVDQCLQSILPVADNRRKIITYSQLASLYYYRGQLQKADNVCRDAIAFCQTVKRTGDEAYFHYLLGEIANDLENSDIYKTEMRRAEQLSASPFPELPLIGASYARTGRLKEADRIMKHISELKSADPYFVKRRNDFIHFIKGEILFAEHVPDKAMKEFMMIEKIHSADPYYLLAQKGIAWCQTERSDTATIRMLTNILERKGEIIFGFVLAIRNSGFWIRSLLPEIHLEIGKIYIRQNNLEAAKLHLRICLNCWQDADEKFQKVKEAQKLLTQLTKEK